MPCWRWARIIPAKSPTWPVLHGPTSPWSPTPGRRTSKVSATSQGVARAKGELFAGAGRCKVSPSSTPMTRMRRCGVSLLRTAASSISAWMPAPPCTAQLAGDTGGCDIDLATPQGEHRPAPAAAGTAQRDECTGGKCCGAVGGRRAGSHQPGACDAGTGRRALQRSTGCRGGITVIDDTYNANPGSLQAALDVLAHEPRRHLAGARRHGRTGRRGCGLHRRGRRTGARMPAWSALFALGELARAAAEPALAARRRVRYTWSSCWTRCATTVHGGCMSW